jgi:hypothetical protein
LITERCGDPQMSWFLFIVSVSEGQNNECYTPTFIMPSI